MADVPSHRDASGGDDAAGKRTPHPEAARLRTLLEPTVLANDLYLEEVQVQERNAQRTIHVVVDLPDTETGGVSLDQIAEVSRDLAAVLDTDPLLGGIAYDLEVSSPGVGRPLIELRHWRRAQGRLVRINQSNGEVLLARVLDVNDSSIFVRPELPVKKGMKPKYGEPTELDPAGIRTAAVEVEFSRTGNTADESAATDDTSAEEA